MSFDVRVSDIERRVADIQRTIRQIQGAPVITAKPGMRFDLNAHLNVADLLRRIESMEKQIIELST